MITLICTVLGLAASGLAFAVKITNKVAVLEAARHTMHEDLIYIRHRVDEIYNRLAE